MPDQFPTLNELQIRKQLHVTEAELQREQLCRDVEVIQRGVRNLEAQAKTIGSIAALIGIAVTGVFWIRRPASLQRNGKPSLFSKLFKGARFASTLWAAVQSRRN